ncbi:PKAR [Malassezia furfur]|nr:PKAR [Malassezia furfur]
MHVPQVQFRGLYGEPGAEASAPADGDFPPNFNFARRTSVSAESMTPQDAEARARVARTHIPKTESQERRIRAATADSLLFRNLEPEQYQAALLALEEVHKEPGDVVIKQGDQGDYFYIVESGELDVYLQPPGTSAAEALAAPADQLGNKVVTYGPGASFGELALLYMQPRAASIVATAPCTLWAVDRFTFRSILAETNLTRRDLFATFLKQVPLLHHLSDEERERVLDAIEVQDFHAGEVVVREGDVGTHFYMIVNGIAEVHKASDPHDPVTRLQRGDYFGELALMRRAAARRDGERRRGPRAFTRLLGPLTGIMARHAETHYHADAPKRDAPPRADAMPEPGSPRSGA